MNDELAATRCGKDPRMVVRQAEPFNAGPPPDLIVNDFVTPTTLFFSRNHAPAPSIDPANYRLDIGGLVARPLNLSLDTLRNEFPRLEITATLLCAGNRRDELMALGEIPGEVAWGSEAISNANWAGVSLRDVLLAAGVERGAAHIAFEGLDQIEKQGSSFGFGGSLPLDKALSPEVLLAYEMNQAALPPLHGFPLRVLAPGYIGARSVKWLARIIAQAAPSDNYYQAHAYKLFAPEVTPENVDWEQGEMLGPVGLNAVIAQPLAGARLAAGAVNLRGYALASSGSQLTHVEVSPDGGSTWHEASLAPEQAIWAWRLWECQLEFAPGHHDILARAYDTSIHVQPDDLAQVWNFKGYMNNAWQHVAITILTD